MNAATNEDNSTKDMQGGLVTMLFGWLRTVAQGGLRGLAKRRSGRRMEMIETLPLGGKRQLMLVRCDGRQYLVGTGGDGVQAIVEVPHASDGATEPCAASAGRAESKHDGVWATPTGRLA